MDRAHLAALLSPYGVNQFESFRVVDSSKLGFHLLRKHHCDVNGSFVKRDPQ